MILLLLWQQKDMMGGVGLVAVCWAAGVTEDLQTDRFFAILEVRMSVQQNVFDDSLVAEEVVSRGEFLPNTSRKLCHTPKSCKHTYM